MSRYTVRLPDVGEGVAEAELIAWLVGLGDRVTPDSALAEVMTDKATVEIACPVTGVVSELLGEPGQVLAVGSDFVVIDLDGDDVGAGPLPSAVETVYTTRPPTADRSGPHALASPAVRARARALGIDLSTLHGSGPDGLVLHEDLDRYLTAGVPTSPSATGGGVETVPLRGLRRRIAERLTRSWAEIPHITYVEAVDATGIEALRSELNGRRSDGARLTLLPFLVRALVLACADQPRLNAHYDAEAQQLTICQPVHVGIATQTPEGLMVPVVRDASSLSLWDVAAEVARLAAAARDGTATTAELTGSTITITSLGALGGLVTTPIINQPEVAIVGVNKMETRPVWLGDHVEPRQMFNLSCSFDHRIVDGWDAAVFVQRLKALLEMPALLFIGE